MIKIVNPTHGTLRFGDIFVKEKSDVVITEDSYNKVRKQTDYAAMKGWCIITEIDCKKTESKVEKEKSKSEVKKVENKNE